MTCFAFIETPLFKGVNGHTLRSLDQAMYQTIHAILTITNGQVCFCLPIHSWQLYGFRFDSSEFNSIIENIGTGFWQFVRLTVYSTTGFTLPFRIQHPKTLI